MTGRTRLSALLLSAAMLFGLSACAVTEDPPPEESTSLPTTTPTAEPQTVDFALGYAASDSLHPLEAVDRSNLDVASLVYEGLYELDEGFVPRPILASAAQVNETALVWTISLREDAAFSDGTPLTAEHVVSSLRTAMKEGSFAARLRDVASVREKDGQVVITLTEPNGNLPALLDVPIVLEREEGLPLGTGPYVVDGDEEEGWLVYTPNWWQGQRPPYDKIPLRATNQLDERVSAFDSGLVTAVTTDFTAPNALGYSSIYETYDFPTTDMLFVGFYTADGPCADPLVRRALSRAFDRASVVTSLLSGHAAAATLPVSPYSEGYPAEIAAELDYDHEEAERLLAEAGYFRNAEGVLVKNRAALTLRFIVNQDSLVKQQIARFLAEDLRQMGIDVMVSELGWDDYMTTLTTGQYDLYLGEVVLTGDFDCSPLLFGALNYGAYWDETVYALQTGWKTSVGSDRDAAAQAFYQGLAGSLPFAVLCFKNDSLLIRWGMVKNLSPLRGNPYAGVESWSAER